MEKLNPVCFQTKLKTDYFTGLWARIGAEKQQHTFAQHLSKLQF